MSQREGLADFLEALDRPSAGLDLTLGRSSILLGAAILLDALPTDELIDLSPLRSRGDTVLTELWQAIDAKPDITVAGIETQALPTGGLDFFTPLSCGAVSPRLRFHKASSGVSENWRRLRSRPTVAWTGLDARTVRENPSPCLAGAMARAVMSFSGPLAHRLLGHPRYLHLAYGAAWRSWDAPDQIVTLCCGLGGRAYALLNLYRHTKEAVWLDRARALAVRGTHVTGNPKGLPSQSLQRRVWLGGARRRSGGTRRGQNAILRAVRLPKRERSLSHRVGVGPPAL